MIRDYNDKDETDKIIHKITITRSIKDIDVMKFKN